MHILAALKKIKHLDRKSEKDLQRIRRWSSYIQEGDEIPEVNKEQPLYDEEEVRRMLQSVMDMANEKARIRHQLHKTNMMTTVTFQGKERTIDELLILQSIIIPAKINALNHLNRKEKGYGHHDKADRVIMQYDPKKKTKAIDDLENLAEEVNAFLDEVSMNTELVE